MRFPLIRQGEGLTAATQRIQQERAREQARLTRITRLVDQPNPHPRAGSTPGGDERKLRGIPAIGRGVAGAIPGTKPDSRITA